MLPFPAKEVARDRVLSDDELAKVILAARDIGARMAALSNCWRSPASVARKSKLAWHELDLHNNEFGPSPSHGQRMPSPMLSIFPINR